MIGISKNKVILAPYSIKWAELYNIEKDLILSSIGHYIVDIQRVGSTSIPGMISKPVIDIVVGLKNFDDGFEIISTIENLGYNFKGSLGKSRKFFFWKGTFEINTFNLHIVEYGDENWENQILFRNFIISHPEFKQDYTDLKLDLAKKFKDDRNEYTNKKSDFIKQIISLAKVEL